MTEKEKIYLNVGVESNHEHSCKGYVLYCEETERSIASFWHEHDAENAELAINSYDQHVEIISRQSEEIKILRDTLKVIFPPVDRAILQEANKALSATEQK